MAYVILKKENLRALLLKSGIRQGYLFSPLNTALNASARDEKQGKNEENIGKMSQICRQQICGHKKPLELHQKILGPHKHLEQTIKIKKSTLKTNETHQLFNIQKSHSFLIPRNKTKEMKDLYSKVASSEDTIKWLDLSRS